MDDLSKKFDRVFSWSLTKNQVESHLGRPVDDLEFEHFCRVFSFQFYSKYSDVLYWLSEEWDREVKHWDVPIIY